MCRLSGNIDDPKGSIYPETKGGAASVRVEVDPQWDPISAVRLASEEGSQREGLRPPSPSIAMSKVKKQGTLGREFVHLIKEGEGKRKTLLYYKSGVKKRREQSSNPDKRKSRWP